eukprot:1001674-Pelagomonas_calceolata.AAC.3
MPQELQAWLMPNRHFCNNGFKLLLSWRSLLLKRDERLVAVKKRTVMEFPRGCRAPSKAGLSAALHSAHIGQEWPGWTFLDFAGRAQTTSNAASFLVYFLKSTWRGRLFPLRGLLSLPCKKPPD